MGITERSLTSITIRISQENLRDPFHSPTFPPTSFLSSSSLFSIIPSLILIQRYLLIKNSKIKFAKSFFNSQSLLFTHLHSSFFQFENNFGISFDKAPFLDSPNFFPGQNFIYKPCSLVGRRRGDRKLIRDSLNGCIKSSTRHR